MFCSNCGTEITVGSKFCCKCGKPTKNIDVVQIAKLKCQECNGIMEVDSDKQVMMCPYCGSKNLIMESDDVKIEKIRSEKDITIERQRGDVEIEKIKLENAEKKRVDRNQTITLVFVIIIGIVLYILCVNAL